MIRLGQIERIGRRLGHVALIAGAMLLLAMLALTCVDVAGRYLLSAPVNGKTELTRFLMAGLIACALPVVSASGEHITVDLLDRFFRGRAAAVQTFIVDLLASLALGVTGYWLVFRADRLMSRGYVSDFLALPLHPVAYFVATMVWLAAIALALKLIVDAYHVARPDRMPERRSGVTAG